MKLKINPAAQVDRYDWDDEDIHVAKGEIVEIEEGAVDGYGREILPLLIARRTHSLSGQKVRLFIEAEEVTDEGEKPLTVQRVAQEMSKDELKSTAKDLGLAVGGSKSELIERIVEHLSLDVEDAPEDPFAE